MSTPVRVVAVVLGVVLLAVAAAFAVTQVRQEEAIPGVTIEGIDVGGLGREDIESALTSYEDERADDTIVLTYEDQRFEVDPREVAARLDVDAVVDDALEAGRDGSFVEARLNELRGVDVTVPAPIGFEEAAVTARIEEIAAEVDAAAVEGEVTVDPASLTVETVDPAEGVEVLVEEATAAVLEAWELPGPDELPLPVEVIPTTTDQADVDAAAEIATTAIAEDLVLASPDGEVALARREVATLISTRTVGEGEDTRIAVVVTEDAVEEVVAPVVDPLLRTPVNARFVTPDTPPVTFDDQDDATWSPRPADIGIVAGSPGTEFDLAAATEQLQQAVRTGARRVELELRRQEAPFSTADAEAAGVDSLLSTFTTYYDCCPPRVQNIQLLADIIDGTTVQPGEQFSINQTSGIRGCEQGFVEDGMILDGEIVPVCGGGISQFGTTTINAVFFAGLKPDAYKPHSFYISRYPMAREATLNYPSPDIDVRFTNDTGAPIIIRTSYSSSSITVSFYGNDDDLTEVRADLGAVTNVQEYDTERRINESLPEGTTSTVQTGIDGFSVGLTRTVVRPGGTTSDDWSFTYVPKRAIVEYNPA